MLLKPQWAATAEPGLPPYKKAGKRSVNLLPARCDTNKSNQGLNVKVIPIFWIIAITLWKLGVLLDVLFCVLINNAL